MNDLTVKNSCPGWTAAEKHLARVDPVFAKIIRAVGPCTLAPRRDHFAALCQSIINQQLSTQVARVIHDRLRACFPAKRPTPSRLLTLTEESLRAAGLSRQKAAYLRNIAEHFASGQFVPRRLAQMTDEEVVQSLTTIKGVGRWTAEMFLIFVLNRTDLLPVGDLGFCKAAQVAYGFRNYPTPQRLQKLAEPWRPYRSIATWYLWRSRRLPANRQD